MKGKCVSSTFIHSFSIRSTKNLSIKCCSMQITYVVIMIFCFCVLSDCNSNFNETVENYTLNGSLPLPSASLSLSAVYSSSEEDYYSDYYNDENNNSTGNGNRRRHDSSKLAQVIIYCCVILIALSGILIKYFVTQYETSQIKAQEQLAYHRLQNQI